MQSNARYVADERQALELLLEKQIDGVIFLSSVVKAGKLAVVMVLDRLAGRCTVAEHVILLCPLVVRASCGAAVGA